MTCIPCESGFHYRCQKRIGIECTCDTCAQIRRDAENDQEREEENEN